MGRWMVSCIMASSAVELKVGKGRLVSSANPSVEQVLGVWFEIWVDRCRLAFVSSRD